MTDVQKIKLYLSMYRCNVIVTVPKTGGARDYLQFSAFLRGKCMARDVFSCSPAVRRAVVATAGAVRPRYPYLRRRL